MSIQHGSRLILPVLFGTGTALPVLVFAFLLAFAAASVGKAFNKLAAMERWVRIAAGTVFVLAGVYYCLVHIYAIGV